MAAMAAIVAACSAAARASRSLAKTLGGHTMGTAGIFGPVARARRVWKDSRLRKRPRRLS